MRTLVFLCAAGGLLSAFGLGLWPDFSNATLPPNIAPLNFRVAGTGPAAVTLRDADGGELRPDMDATGVARWREGDWHAFLSRNAGRPVFFDVSCGSDRRIVTNRVATEMIDARLVYRLVPPGYTGFSLLRICRRDLTSFAEETLVRNVERSYHRCLNCHVPNRADPEEYVCSFRAVDAGTRIVSRRYGDRFQRLEGLPGWPGTVAYPAWHPSGDFIAFAVSETRQAFPADGRDFVEVVDLSSNVMLYSLSDGRKVAVEGGADALETCPEWSPDGRTLYTVRTADPLGGVAGAARMEKMRRVLGEVRYDLVARDFDVTNRVFSAPRTLYRASAERKSAAWPRASADGRWLVLTLADHGYFHVWHGDADLYLFDLRTGAVRALDEINSPAAESYHSFSHDGRWLVFSSRRDDGAYTRPYFARFDPDAGRFDPPFPLPLASPDDYFRRMESYNVPEFER